jgi:hypothetical protein
MRMAMAWRAPLSAAMADSRSSSGSDSTLISATPTSMAKASSAAVLPTPEKMIRSGGAPAARARRISPSETVSAPAPRANRVLSTDRLELALTAKAISGAPDPTPRKASRSTVKCRSRVALE